MTFSITYDASIVDGSQSVSDYLTHWAASYNETYYCHAEVQYTSYEGFWSTTSEQPYMIDYNVCCTLNGVTAVVSDGSFGYDESMDMFTDILNTLHFGEGLALSSDTGFYLESEAVTFEGLGDIITDPMFVNMFLMAGDVSELLYELEAAGIDTMASIDSYAPMTEEIAPMSDVIGVLDNTDMLMAA